MSPARANVKALAALALMALAAGFVAVSAILFVPLTFAAMLLGAAAIVGNGPAAMLVPVAALLFLAAWNCALATESLADAAPVRVAWLAARTIALVGGCWLLVSR